MKGRRGDVGTEGLCDVATWRIRPGAATRRARAGLTATGFNLPVSPSPRLSVSQRGGAPWL